MKPIERAKPDAVSALIPNLTGMADDLLTSKEVAALLGVTDRSLERWRTAGAARVSSG